MKRRYRYVGPEDIATRVVDGGGGLTANTMGELRGFLRSFDEYRSGGSLTVTFTVGVDGSLRVADRRSEHVACAKGEDVLSAGEMKFSTSDKDDVFVERVTNQSTGYCPEPESWEAVARALDRIAVKRPNFFDPISVFRRCSECSQINIVKDDWYRCGVCDSPLPAEWNF